MHVARWDISGQPLLEVFGDADHAAAPDLRRAVTEVFGADASHILFDLSSCLYLNSGGVSTALERPGAGESKEHG